MGQQSSHYRCALWPAPKDHVSKSIGADGKITVEIMGRTFFLVIVLRRFIETDADYEESQYLIGTRVEGILRELGCGALPVAPDGTTFTCPYGGAPGLGEFLLANSEKTNSFGLEGMKIAFDTFLFFEAYKPASQ